MPSPRPQPRQPTHYEPPGSMPGLHFADLQRQQGSKAVPASSPAGASGGRFWHGFAVRWPPVWRPGCGCPTSEPDTCQMISLNKVGRRKCLFLLTVETEECPTAPTTRSSDFYRRRTLPAPAACHVAPSIARLPEGSCGRLGSAIGFGFSPPSWSAGSSLRRSPPTFRSGHEGHGSPDGSRGAACALCSTRRATDRRRLR
jgi:hypothetical protein